MTTLSATARKLLPQVHVRLYRATNGRIGGRFGDAEVLLLTTTGRRSGQARTTPLNHYKDGDRIVLVASNGGSDQPPAWFLNAAANPTVTVERKSEVKTMTARVASDAERAELWPKIVAWYAGYGKYQAKTDRIIPLLILQ
jgi:deazaflavin-dependent oxidoreductase (nitroreductase family)